MFARASSVAVVGIDGFPVDVEVQVAQGLPAFTVVGLPDASIQESRERVRAAVAASGQTWPNQRITVNLSPAHLPKQGSGFDLAIALGVLAATAKIPSDRLPGIAAIGELSLDGRVRRVRGALAAVGAAAAIGRSRILVPAANVEEARVVDGIDVIPVETLAQAVGYLRGTQRIDAAERAAAADAVDDELDWSDVRGQTTAKRAMEIAAAGGHNVLMSGPPGGGKTMLARRLPGIMPPLSREEALIVTRLYSVAGLLPDGIGLIANRPVRAPHHSISTAGLVGGGGGGIPSPGEVSLAHRGVLFLDEAAEFRRDALQALRGPLEDGRVTISRARFSVTYPCRAQLVMATNPCPCGNLNSDDLVCTCLPGRVVAYGERLSGPLLDRVDISVAVPRAGKIDILNDPQADDTESVRARVVAARARQADRLAEAGVSTNAEIPVKKLRLLVDATRDAIHAAERSASEAHVSMRAVHRVLRVARTIADLEDAGRVTIEHVCEAFNFRNRGV